jgi:chemotaxis signal transduction protein
MVVTDTLNRFFVFCLADCQLAVDLLSIKRILSEYQIQELHSSSGIQRVAKYRDEVIGIINPATIFPKELGSPHEAGAGHQAIDTSAKPSEFGSRTVLIILETDKGLFGLETQEILGIKKFSEIHAPKEFQGILADRRFFDGMARCGEELVYVFNIARYLQSLFDAQVQRQSVAQDLTAS